MFIWWHEFDSGPTDIFSQNSPSLFRIGSLQLPMLSVWEFFLDGLKLCGQRFLVREFDRKAGLLSGCTLVFFLDFRQPIVPSTQKRKFPRSRNRTGDLRMSSFTTVLRSTNWAIGRITGGLSDRFVWWSDCLWLIHVSSQQTSRLLCSSRFFSWWYLMLFGIR